MSKELAPADQIAAVVSVGTGQDDPSPLEIIFQLLEQRRLDLSTVNLVQVTNDFLAHIEREQIDTLTIGDYLEALSKLLLLKLNHLLKLVEPEPEITVNLERFREVRRARLKLRRLWLAGPRVLGSARLPESLGAPLPLLTPTVLAEGLNGLFQEAVIEQRQVVLKKKVSLERARQALETIVSREHQVVLQEQFPDRDFLVVVFLVSLLLYREQVIEMEQESVFGKIIVRRMGAGQSAARTPVSDRPRKKSA